MAMEGVIRSSTIAAALLFLTLAVLAAASASGDDAAAASAEEQWHPLANDEPYELVTFFHNTDGEETIRLLADQRSELVSAYGFANRSGHWFYAIREKEEGNGGKRHRRLPLPLSQSKDSRSRTEGLWNTLGALANTTAASDDDSDRPAADDDDERYMVLGMQTSGGDKIRLLVVAGQGHFFITGFARGFFRCPDWIFREGERHSLLTTLSGNGGSSHAEVVASNVLAALMKEASQRA